MLRLALAFCAPALLLASGCTGTDTTAAYSGLEPLTSSASARRNVPAPIDWRSAYAARNDGDIAIPAFHYKRLSKRYRRQRVRYFGPETAGSVVVDAGARHLYFIEKKGIAIRYGIAVGREGFGWTGNARIARKDDWPTWTPPAKMIERKPSLASFANGMPGGPENPLGARALYLYKNGQDTLYRIHGTNKPYSIGKRASSGCFRMINQDVIDLYDRASRGAKVLVKPEVDMVAALNNGR